MKSKNSPIYYLKNLVKIRIKQAYFIAKQRRHRSADAAVHSECCGYTQRVQCLITMSKQASCTRSESPYNMLPQMDFYRNARVFQD